MSRALAAPLLLLALLLCGCPPSSPRGGPRSAALWLAPPDAPTRHLVADVAAEP